MDNQAQKVDLYQVWGIRKADGNFVPLPMFPRVMKEVADEYVATVKSMINLGKETRFTEPQALLSLGNLDSQ